MVPRQLPLIRAVAQAALQQHKLTPCGYDDVVQFIDQLERDRQSASDSDLAIRQASEAMISRLQHTAMVFDSAPDAGTLRLEAL